MALGYLFLVFVIMSILALIGTVFLFLTKNKASDILLVVMALYSVLIAFLSATAQPANYIGAQILAWVVGAVALIGLAVRFFAKKQLVISKVLVVASVITGIYLLYFS